MAEQLHCNPRYLAYAGEHGHTVEQQLEHDRAAWPGGHMCGFILWSNERVAEYAKINPGAFFKGILTPWDRHGGRPQLLDHDAYNLWLKCRNVQTGSENFS
jgi:hypothetical protein